MVEGRFLGGGVLSTTSPCEQTSKLPVLMHSFCEETQFPALLYAWYWATALGYVGENFANYGLISSMAEG